MANLELTLSQPDSWTITKTLGENDLGFQFLLPKRDMEDYIITELKTDSVNPISASDILDGHVLLRLLDVDTGVGYLMRLTQTRVQNMPGSYYFRNMWGDLKRDRDLRIGDVIGISWDKWNHQFLFHVIYVAPRQQQQQQQQQQYQQQY
ncbi:PREDICTED: putative B3 domain-containing protein At1g51970 [Camelina sativa]|uniref:B3 domain-containing protein At1g51970 n=1 Tax=Camelina sativa TaxID=90675 RepID=A0ABM0V5C5_CAMSA|nr:PREDICTED: putative B3 domain-containing protein At1g51970 [Camelina sativa]